MAAVAGITRVEDEVEAAVARARAELKHRFAGAGCVARSTEFARLLPGGRPEWAEEALHRLCEEGIAELVWLADGALAFHFPRR